MDHLNRLKMESNDASFILEDNFIDGASFDAGMEETEIDSVAIMKR